MGDFMYEFIVSEFYREMGSVDLNTYGILDFKNKIHTLGTDSKIIGRIFEMITQPVLEKIASEHNMILKTPKSQTVYPDFVMMTSEEANDKVAVDIKTTYIKHENSSIKFTLGSYGSYMRNNTKNIEYCYTDYAKHFVIGFVYKRNDAAQESRVYDYEDRSKIVCPFYDVRYFIQEKYKIAGDKPGSGDTENIGSFVTKSFDDLKNGRGPFSILGEEVFDLYWKYYPKYRATVKEYISLPGFLKWFLDQPKDKVTLLHNYDYENVRKIIENAID